MTRNVFVFVSLVLLLAACTPTVAEVPTLTPEPPSVTNTPIPTNEPEPTETPLPTSTPEPTATPSPTPLPYYTAEEAEEIAGMEALYPEEYGDFVWGNPDVNLQIQQTDASKREIGDLQFNKEEPKALINPRILEFMTQEVGRIFGYNSAEEYRAAREAGEVRSVTFTWGENTYTVDSDKPVVVVFDANPEPPDYVSTGNMLVEANEIISQQNDWFGSPDTTGPANKSELYVHMEGRDGHLVYVAGSNFDSVSARNLPNWLLAETYRALYLMILVMENGGKPENGMMREGEGTLSPHTKEFDFGTAVGIKESFVLIRE